MHRAYHRSCCSPFTFYPHTHRRFLTKEELEELTKRQKEKKIKWMTRYKESLEKELQGINERLEAIQKETT